MPERDQVLAVLGDDDRSRWSGSGRRTCTSPLARTPGALVKLIGKSTIVGSVGLSTAIGAPTLTVTPAGAEVKVRSAAERVEKTTGLLKVTWMTLGAEVDRRPVGRRGRADAEEVDRVEGVDGVDEAVAAPESHAPAAAPFIGWSAEAIRPALDLGRGERRDQLLHQRGDGRRVRRRRRGAEEAGQVLREVGRSRRLAGERGHWWCR